MRHLVINCDRCKAELTHRCNADLVQAIVDLYTWAPERGMPDYMIREGKRVHMYSKGGETAPFMTESFLYTALGKEDARTLLALVRTVIEACGIDKLGINKAIFERLEAISKDREDRAMQQRRAELLREIRRANEEGFDVVEEEWPLLAHLAKYADRYQIEAPFKRAGKQWKKFIHIDRKDQS